MEKIDIEKIEFSPYENPYVNHYLDKSGKSY